MAKKQDRSLASEDTMTDQMEQMIGQQLRTLYDGVIAEPIPARILELLQQLDQVSSAPTHNGRDKSEQ